MTVAQSALSSTFSMESRGGPKDYSANIITGDNSVTDLVVLSKFASVLSPLRRETGNLSLPE